MSSDTQSSEQVHEPFPWHAPRIVLRRFNEADVNAFFAYRNDPKIARYQDWEGIELAEATSYLRRSLWFKGQWADEYLYAMLREEWLRRGARPVDGRSGLRVLRRGGV